VSLVVYVVVGYSSPLSFSLPANDSTSGRDSVPVKRQSCIWIN